MGSAPTLLGAAAGTAASPAGMLLCGWLLPPVAACLCALTCTAAQWCLLELRGLPAGPGFWVSAASWLGCAAATAALCHNGSKGRCYLGCLAGGTIVLAAQLVVSRMENGGSWTALPPEVLAAAVGSTILACMCVLLFGTPQALNVDGADADRYIEDSQEGEVAL